jgi:glycerol-3-phosphate dehydrogenase
MGLACVSGLAESLAGDGMITRAPAAATAQRFDLAVIGGGIHGVCVALQAAERGLRVLLLERADFGSGASGNSLRVVHGGLRYLQSLDVTRFRESVAERRWFARIFPGLIEPLPCLMPLYGEGLRRRVVMRAALTMNDALSSHRNNGVEKEVWLPGSATFGAAAMRRRFRQVRAGGLEGGALWYDYHMRSSERILTELLHAACAVGVQALNYTEVKRLRVQDGRIQGLEALDRLDGKEYRFEAERICNCTGAQARVFAAEQDRDYRELFIPSLAFNVLLDCEPLSRDALAVAAPEPGAPVYFLCPAPFGVWAGTEHVGRPELCRDAVVSDAEIDAFLGRINRAIPGINLALRNVRSVYCGLLPVHTPGGTDLTARECCIAHADHGGPVGLYSLTGMKFTTARRVAERALEKLYPGLRSNASPCGIAVRPLSAATALLLDGARVASMDPLDAMTFIRDTAAAESVMHPEDFFLRRTNWMFTAPQPAMLERLVATALDAAPRESVLRTSHAQPVHSWQRS